MLMTLLLLLLCALNCGGGSDPRTNLNSVLQPSRRDPVVAAPEHQAAFAVGTKSGFDPVLFAHVVEPDHWVLVAEMRLARLVFDLRDLSEISRRPVKQR